jgi:hypothetical protein
LKTRKEKTDGFVLVILLAIITLIAVDMYILTSGSNTLLFQTNDAYLRACQQNLIASGLAWVQQNVKHPRREGFGKPLSLDITDMNISRAALSVTVNTPVNGQADVRVDSSVSRNRQRFSSKQKYLIKL